jgi:hypothetical protein
MTLAVYFCNQCQKVESYVTFPPDRVAEADAKQYSPDDMLSQLYYEHKAFRRN